MKTPQTEAEWKAALVQLRKEGLSQYKIAARLGVSQGCVQRRWHLLSEREQQRKTVKRRVFAFLDGLEDAGSLTARQIADQLGCSRNTVMSYRVEWRRKRGELKDVNIQHCTRCGFAGWEHSPILPDGVCLQCHLDLKGINSLTLAETGTLSELVEKYG